MSARDNDKKTSYVVTDATIKAIALDWFQRGFACSGFGAHGESRLKDSSRFQKLLEVEFERVWSERRTGIIHPSPDAARPPTPPSSRKR